MSKPDAKTQKAKKQVAAFRSAARELGADKSAKRFNDALKTVVRQRLNDKSVASDNFRKGRRP